MKCKFPISASVFQGENGRWLPIYKGEDKRLAVMSIAFLLGSPNDAVIWRGPKKTSMIKQFVQDIEWGELDFLVVDTPPGTSDEHITVAECMNDPSNKAKCVGAIIVTTPQEVALEDTRKEITFCRKTNLNVIGILENMSGYECPSCSECSYIFSNGGGEALAERANVALLGSLPIDQRVAKLSRCGQSAIKALPDSTTAKVLTNVVNVLREA